MPTPRPNGDRRQWGRGRTAAECTRADTEGAAESSFNGAAAARPRNALTYLARGSGLQFLLQWGRGRTAAECCSARPIARPRKRFNGAAAARPRNVANALNDT